MQLIDYRRRLLLGLPLALPLALAAWPSAAQTYPAAAPPPPPAPAAPPAPAPDAAAQRIAPDAPAPVRLALLLGNGLYPSPHDLPPIHKNVRDLGAALEQRDFRVSTALDLDPAAQRRTIQAFAAEARAAPPDATVLFYFAGHGLQVDAENLMLGAGVAPNARPEVLLSGSLHLQRDIVEQLPRRSSGLTITVIDACRVDLRAALAAQDGLNQVEAPPGCLIVFSTAAGRPAIAPARETDNTFYTASLVKLLRSADDALSFSDLFRLVKLDVQQTMLSHPVPVIRQFAQVPFIAENTQVKVRLSPRPTPEEALQRAADEQAAWSELEASLWPAEVARLAEAYQARWPGTARAGSAQVSQAGAEDAVRALASPQVRLYRSAFQPRSTQPGWLAEWHKAARGDKDAAARIARAYRNGSGDIPRDDNRYEGWLQYASALGNGIACYELAVWYRRQGQPVPAAQFEARSRELGYTPPPTLDHYRK
ncbi:MAG: caspase family protein [Piscinibacter sp.]|uniref:caspase family protein n=1 Tax=Piscinibacter sp. TaxID=1903157 RepID=UPI00258EE887|nr:caspase family protein [Piscinibacter sp.]MCW5665832.1 caspase family protein [Piscinibacter sp.]